MVYVDGPWINYPVCFGRVQDEEVALGKHRDLAKGAWECQPGNEVRVRDGFAGWLFNVVTRIRFDLEIQSGSNPSGPHRTRFRR